MDTLFYVLAGLAAGAVLFWVRTRYFGRKPLTATPLGRTALAMGLQPRVGGDRFYGEYNGAVVTVEPLRDRDGETGVQIRVSANAPMPGEIRLSGPSENAGSGQPAAKLRVGDGPFDFHFWVAKSSPKEAATELLMPLDDVRAQMLDAPFGQWIFTGKTALYQSYRIPPDAYVSALPLVADVLTTIAKRSSEA